MYAAYFGLNEDPFAITPDPRYLYLSNRHREALAHLIYGLEHSGGFVQLTGEIGSGKTTTCRSLLNSLPEHVDVALILNPALSVGELLLAICKELRIKLPRGRITAKQVIDRLNTHLLESNARGRRTVLIIDEAQNLNTRVLEQIRLLTNLETERRKLLQIFLIGQPELRTILAQKALRQLAQRITARYHLGPLTPAETAEYIRHRLRVAGGEKMLFSPAAVHEIYRRSGGVPRTVNILCDRALLGAYVIGKEGVSARIVRNSALEIAGKAVNGAERWWTPYAWAAAGVFAVAGVALTGYYLSAAQRTSAAPELAHAAPPKAKAVPKAKSAEAAAKAPAKTAQTASPAPAAPAPITAPAAAAVAQATPSPAPVAAPATSLTEALVTQAQNRSVAERRLLGRWGLPYPADAAQPLCQWAVGHGLECLNRQGSWADLRRLNRPAMLWLSDAAGHHFYGVVYTLTDDSVRLDLGGQEQNFALSAVQPYWHGQFLLLWKPPVPAVAVIREGAPAAAVRWLRTALNKVQSPPTLDEQSSAYDWPVLKQVMAFQRRAGLPVDGTVGAETFIMLRTAMGAAHTPLIAPPPSIAQVTKGD